MKIVTIRSEEDRDEDGKHQKLVNKSDEHQSSSDSITKHPYLYVFLSPHVRTKIDFQHRIAAVVVVAGQEDQKRGACEKDDAFLKLDEFFCNPAVKLRPQRIRGIISQLNDSSDARRPRHVMHLDADELSAEYNLLPADAAAVAKPVVSVVFRRTPGSVHSFTETVAATASSPSVARAGHAGSRPRRLQVPVPHSGVNEPQRRARRVTTERRRPNGKTTKRSRHAKGDFPPGRSGGGVSVTCCRLQVPSIRQRRSRPPPPPSEAPPRARKGEPAARWESGLATATAHGRTFGRRSPGRGTAVDAR